MVMRNASRVAVTFATLLVSAMALLAFAMPAHAAEGDLQFVGFTGDSVSGSSSDGYTVYVRDGDTVDVTLSMRNNSGKALEYVSMTASPSFPATNEGDDDFEPIAFPPHRGNEAWATNAEYCKDQWYTSETTGVGYYGYWVEVGATPTFKLKVSAGDLSTGTYNWTFRLGRERWDYENRLIVVDPTLSYREWTNTGTEVEEVYSAEIPIKVVVYSQDGASLKAGTGSPNNLTQLPSTGVDFGTIDLATAAEDELTGSQTVIVVNGAAANSPTSDNHGNSTAIKVVFGGENTIDGTPIWDGGAFTFGNGKLYDDNWAPLEPATTSGNSMSINHAEYTIDFDATYLVEGTYTGNLIINTVPRKVKVNGVEGNATGVYRIPVKLTLTGVNPRLLPQATDLTAVPGNGLVELTWASPEGATEYTEYSIYRRVGAETQTDPNKLDWSLYEKIGTKVKGGDEELLYIDGEVENGTTYTYTVVCGTPNHGYASETASATPLDSIEGKMLAPFFEASDAVKCVSLYWEMNERYGGSSSDGVGMVDHFNIYRDGVLVDAIYQSAVEDNVEMGWVNDGQGTLHWGVTKHEYGWSVDEPVPELYMSYTWAISAVSPSGVESYLSETTPAQAVDETPSILSHQAQFTDRYIPEGSYDYTPAILLYFEEYGDGNSIETLSIWRKEGGSAPSTSEAPYATVDKHVGNAWGMYDYADTGIKANTLYTYTAQGEDDEGNKTNLYTFSIKTPNSLSNPADADMIDFNPVDVKWSVVDNGTTARLRWNCSYYEDYDNNQWAYVGTYRVYRDDALIETLTSADADEGLFDLRDNPGADGTYTYRVDKEVQGVTLCGRDLVFTRNTQPVNPESLLQVPDAPMLSGRTSGESNVILSWAPATTGGTPEGYHIYRSDAGIVKTGGRTVRVPNYSGYSDEWSLWGNGRYMSLSGGDARTFVDGTSGDYQGDPYLGRTENLNWNDEYLPHVYYITAYNRAGESEPSQLVVFDSHGEDQYGNAIAPANDIDEAPTAPSIERVWIDWDDQSSYSGGFDNVVYGDAHVAWSDTSWNETIDSWTATFAGTHFDAYNPPQTDTLEYHTAVLHPAAKLGTTDDSPTCMISGFSGDNGDLGRTITVTVSANNGVGTATSTPVSMKVESLPRFYVLPDNGGALLRWTDLVDDTTTQVASWEIWRKAKYGVWERAATLAGSQEYAGTQRTLNGTVVNYYEWADSELDNGWSYQYKVIAKCADDVDRPSVVREITPSNAAAVEAPGAPQGLTAQVVDGIIYLNWNKPAAGGAVGMYSPRCFGPEIDWYQSAVGDVSGSSTSTTYKPDKAGTYKFLVWAYSEIDGQQTPKSKLPYEIDGYDEMTDIEKASALFVNPSNVIEVEITEDDIASQSGDGPGSFSLTLTPGDGEIALSWTASENAVRYTVERHNNDYPKMPDVVVAAVAGQQSYTYVDDTAEPGVKYRYVVTARSANGVALHQDGYAKATGKTVDQIAAEQMETLIAALPEPDAVTVNDANQIMSVQEAWESLTAKQKALVNAELAQKLADDVDAVEQLRLRAQYEELVAPVQALIDDLPDADAVKASDAEQIQAAREAYEAITPAEAKRIVETARLVAAEEALATLSDREAAAAVVALIDALPSLDGVEASNTTAIEEARVAVDAAREAFNALTGTQIGYLPEAYDLKLSTYEEQLAALEKAVADQTAADEAEGFIGALPDLADIELSDRAAIEAARAAYEALSDEAKALVENYDDLVAAEAKLAELQEQFDEQQATQVDGVIAGLPELESIGLANKAAIEEARAAYEALTAEQKKYVTHLAALEAAETRIADLETAQAVVALIDQIDGTITLDSEDAITAARDAYDRASAFAQSQVGNYDELVAAESRLQELKDEAAVQRVLDMIAALPEELTLDNREAIDEALAAYDQLTDAQKTMLDGLDADAFTRLTNADTQVKQLEAEAAEAVRIDIATGKVTLAKTSLAYTGKALKPGVKLVVGGKTLTLGTHFTAKYTSNVKVGTGKVTLTGIGAYKGTKAATFKIVKAANTLKVTGKTATAKYLSVKKKNVTLKVGKVLKFASKGQGTKTYAKKKGNKKIVIDKKTGNVTVKKGLKKGKYKVTVAVKATGNANYKAKTVKVAFTVKVK